MHDILSGFSRGMYSNWLWHKPLRLLVDAGEGLQLALGSSVFAPSYLAITHGHSDHVLGLPGLVAARRFGKGAQTKPLTVFFPEGSRGVLAVRALLDQAYPGVGFPVTWHPMRPGDGAPLDKTRTIRALPVQHTPGEPALGYIVVESRRRLKAEFASLPQADIEARARRGEREALMEETSHILFAHSGDAMPLDPAQVTHADVLVHDATFLNLADRREPIHATTEEALAVGREAHARALVLQHLSIRYDRASALPALQAQVAASGYHGDVWLLDDAHLLPLQPTA